MESLRTFVAINVKVDTYLKNKWQELKNLLRNDSINWVDEHSLHLTLFFLGNTPINLIGSISQKLELELQKGTSFNIKLQGFGTFGNPNSPKVIWLGIAKSEQLLKLKQIISGVISTLGFEEQIGNFSPHFTLGRVKRIQTPNDLIDFINRERSIIFQENKIENVLFYQSILKPSGPIYKPIKIFKLPSL